MSNEKIMLPDVDRVGDYSIVDGKPYINDREVRYYGDSTGEGCDKVYVFEGCNDDGDKEVYLAGGFGLELTITFDLKSGEISYSRY